MLQEKEILDALDQSGTKTYSFFIWLGDVYSYLIDSRLNIFHGDNDKWAIAGERLGYNPRQGCILLEIFFFGNCLINLEEYNGQKRNTKSFYPIDENSFQIASNDREGIKDNAEFVLVRGQQIKLTHNKADYEKAGVILKEYEPNEISWEEVGRFLITEHRNLFRATEEEFYIAIPKDMQKLLIIDEWYHKDFSPLPIEQILSDEQINQIYNSPGMSHELTFETLLSGWRQQEKRNKEWNENQWNENRPGSYETWQLIAKVISTGDISFYKPTLKPNSHWTNWNESGSL